MKRPSSAIAALLFVAATLAGCAGGGRSVPTSAPAAPGHGAFAVPASLPVGIPPAPPRFVPALPSAVQRSTSSAHPAFFAGEAALSNGVYYLALPNGNPFGYYSYLSDQSYIYHFDAGYEYVLNANDGGGGVYFYDFASGHWWYTSRVYPFPYVYDFSLNTVLYYYPDTNKAGHSTTNPRYFYNFKTGKIIALPDPNAAPTASVASLSFAASGPDFAQQFTVSQQSYSGAFVLSGIDAAVATATISSNVVTVTPVAGGTTNLTVTGGAGRSVTIPINVTTLIISVQ